MMSISVALHALAAVVWVGGMFFAYVVLRPSVGAFAAGDRLRLWERVFGRFFPWVMACVAVLLLTGYTMLFAGFGGFAGAGVHVHAMQLTGWIMVLLFLHLHFAPWGRLRRALAEGDLESAGRQLGLIRRIVATNLALGIVTVAIGSSGRWWG
jgi:uncharacterized membrane protein